MTYQRLRQICNSDYEVPSFRPNTPGDNCDDQLSTCCCNSVAWALSMLCMNCQWDTDSSSVNGIDAGVPAYYWYRFGGTKYCGDGTNQTLPSNIETAVCNEGIKLQDFLYGLFWTDGSWCVTYTRESAQQDDAASGSNVYHCTSSTSSTHSSTSTSAIAASSSANPTSNAQPTSSSGVTSSNAPGSNSPASGSSSSSSSTTSEYVSSSIVTTFESRTTVNGSATSVAVVTTLVTVVPSSGVNGTAVGLGTTSGGHKASTGAIAGGVIGGVAALLLLGILAVWFTRRKRSSASGPLVVTDAASESSHGPMSPNTAERNSISPFMAQASRSDPFANPAPPGPSEKWARMHQNTSSSTFPTSTSNTGSGTSSGTGTTSHSRRYGSRDQLHHAQPPTESASSYSQMGPGSQVEATDSIRPVVQEEDAGRLTLGSLRLPPAYQSEWNAE
ncbi:uncharacterized protein C8Q71DRAFT_266818 [Rhodofomes roseus]|uniref:Uncharacterized protein n=1 Tax=Rhodofomes roseus TaxID=34475 RepID=A0ABQ8K5E8_9APHY|nr:uncharacterized protein C8Q71DRAFT_266818 [Rhodofomes roseus]KAH9832214.1 hypothetical protein C8Q71DRAFT_266818 [Rhodofomes roseus]